MNHNRLYLEVPNVNKRLGINSFALAITYKHLIFLFRHSKYFIVLIVIINLL